MKTIRIVLSIYTKLSIANFILAMEAILDALTGNPYFATPNPTLPELQADLDALKTRAAAVKAGNLALKPERDLARSVMYANIQALAVYCLYTVTNTSENIEEAVTKIRSARLVVAEPGQHIGPLPAPANVRGKSLSQAVEIEYDAVRGAHMYLILKTVGLPTDSSVWTESFTTRAKYKFENIPAGQIITVRVCALGPVGKGEASDYCSVVAGV